jgi:hypothetical protein
MEIFYNEKNVKYQLSAMANTWTWIENRNKIKFWTYVRFEPNADPKPVLRIPDPESGAFFAPRSGMEKNLYPGSGMNILDLIFENLESASWDKNT